MSTGQLHAIGRGHEARFAEDFDQVLAETIRSTPDPTQAAAELDDVTLLTVLANYAGVGPYDPADPPDEQLLTVLRVDPANPSFGPLPGHGGKEERPWAGSSSPGKPWTPAHTVVADLWFDPA